MSRTAQVWITLNGKKIRESEKAVLYQVIKISGEEIEPKSEWFPFSQVQKIHTNPNDPSQNYIIVSEWILKQKNMISDRPRAIPTQQASDGVIDHDDEDFDPYVDDDNV